MKNEFSCPIGKKYIKKERLKKVSERLSQLYPAAECALRYEGDPFRLLVMARLSAQCTDKRVNEVSKVLFEKFPDVYAFAKATQGEIEELIRSCGLFRTKAKNILDMSVMLIEKYGGEVPEGMEELLSLPGVGTKIANLVRGDYFNLGGIVADTHCIRISHRLGFTSKADQRVTERELEKLVKKSEQSDFCHRIVLFGRDCCKAQNPDCENCPLREITEERS